MPPFYLKALGIIRTVGFGFELEGINFSGPQAKRRKEQPVVGFFRITPMITIGRLFGIRIFVPSPRSLVVVVVDYGIQFCVGRIGKLIEEGWFYGRADYSVVAVCPRRNLRLIMRSHGVAIAHQRAFGQDFSKVNIGNSVGYLRRVCSGDANKVVSKCSEESAVLCGGRRRPR